MVFNSWTFALFLPLVLGLYLVLPHRGQNWLLLAASYFFYGWWDWRFLGLLAATTLVDWAVAILLERPGLEARRKKRNDIEQETRVEIERKNLDAEKQRLQISRDVEYARLEQQREVEIRKAEQAALIAQQQAAREQEAVLAALSDFAADLARLQAAAR